MAHDSYKIRVILDGLRRTEPKEFYFRVEGPDAPSISPKANFAIAAALPIAMSKGANLHCEGAADADFLAGMEECAAAWSRWRPDLFKPIRVSAASEIAPKLPIEGPAVMAFSGGLDSVFALHAHKRNLLGRRQLDIAAAVLVQGFDIPLDGDKAFSTAYGHVRALLDTYDVRLNIAQTDWQKHFCVKWGMAHIFGLTAVLQLFGNSFSAGVFADDFSYDSQWMPWSNNAVTNQMLGSAAFPIVSTGARWFRTEKAIVLSRLPAVLEHLRVCYARPDLGENCGRCEKCIRTKVNFYAAGIDSVPSLQPPLKVEDIERLPVNSESVIWYRDALEKGIWPPGDPMRSALIALIDDHEKNVRSRRMPSPKNIAKHARTTMYGLAGRLKRLAL